MGEALWTARLVGQLPTNHLITLQVNTAFIQFF